MGLVLLTRSSHNGGPRLVLARSDTGSCPPATILHSPCKTSVNHLLAPGQVKTSLASGGTYLVVGARGSRTGAVGDGRLSLQEVPAAAAARGQLIR